jgi:hypothetical protein
VRLAVLITLLCCGHNAIKPSHLLACRYNVAGQKYNQAYFQAHVSSSIPFRPLLPCMLL